MKTQATTWSGSQAARVLDSLNDCLTNKMVTDFFDDTEKEVLKVLIERAQAGHALAIAR